MNDDGSVLNRLGIAPAPVPVFHRSTPLPCPYVPGRVERRVIAELSPTLFQTGAFDALTTAGFRRSHNLVYRPSCPSCTACVPVRIPVEQFRPKRTLARIRRANAELEGEVVPARATSEQYGLFRRYQQARHGDGEMAAMDWDDYRALIEDGAMRSRLVELRDPDGRLIGCCLIDVIVDGMSAVYSFFAPEQPERSLGSLVVLWLIEETRRRGLPYLYLGYWIEECRKMAYKVRFDPIERLGPNGWQPLDVE